MKSLLPRHVPVVLALALLLPLSVTAASWQPVTPEELAIDKPTVQADAGVEVLFREMSIDDSNPEQTSLKTYVRLKVFDERGVKALEKMTVYYNSRSSRLSFVAARVIKPDGTAIEVDRKSFFTRDVVRNRYLRTKAISFSFAGLEPGVIAEYQFTENVAGLGGMLFPFQDEFPARSIRLNVRPFAYPRLKMQTIFFGFAEMPLKKGHAGFFSAERLNVPAAVDEPFGPPADQTRPWMLFYFTLENTTAEKFWQEIGRDLFKDNEKLFRPRSEIQQAVAKIVAGATDDADKLARIDTYCRVQISNLAADQSGYTPDQIEKLAKNNHPGDTLAHGYGWRSEIRELFVALARAAGFDARLALAADRSRLRFDRNVRVQMALPDQLVAVKVGPEWRFFQPDIQYLAPGSLHWTNEGQVALVGDAKEPVFTETSSTPKEASLESRTARLRLADDGTIEGDVEIVLTGHLAQSRKQEYDDESSEGRETLVRDDVGAHLGGAEVTAIVIEGAAAPTGPLTIRYHLRVPNYAERTGQRLFLQPGIFEKSTAAVFTASTRQLAVFFPYTRSERDHVEIEIPEGYALENADAPAAFPGGDNFVYEPRLAFRPKSRVVVYDRALAIGFKGVAVASYAVLKQAFDHVRLHDQHSVTLRRENPAPVAATSNESAAEPAVVPPAE